MNYPQGFPDDLRPLVDRALANAEVEFRKHKLGTPDFDVMEEIFKYVEKVFFVFAKQAGETGKRGVWKSETIRTEVGRFLHDLIYSAYFDKEPARSDSRHQLYQLEITDRIKDSVGWIRHQRGMAALATIQAAKSGDQTKPKSRAQLRRDFVQPYLDAKALTASQWADKAGFDTSVIYDYLHGRSNPRPATRQAMAEVLGIPVSELPD